MKYLKFSMCLSLFIFCGGAIAAQELSIKKELKLMQTAYKKHAFLSYDVQYLYAKEKTPLLFIDTVMGNYKLHQGKYWGKLDNVECIQSDSFFISVYEEDKVILLNSSAPVWMQANVNWDSIWQHADTGMKISIKVVDGLNQITMQNLNENSSYQRIVLWYSPEDYLVKKMQYMVRQPYEQPDDSNNQPEEVPQEELVIIEIRFSNYQTSVFDKGIFAAESYIERSGKEFKPAKRYNDYTVLVGTPDLLN